MFIFNLAPRKDGTWGAIVSRELYKAQKRAGDKYRSALAHELARRLCHREIRRRFRVDAIPHHVERALAKRRQAIEAAATEHGYRSPKGSAVNPLFTFDQLIDRLGAPWVLSESWRDTGLVSPYPGVLR